MADDQTVLDTEARLKNFISKELKTISNDMRKFAKVGKEQNEKVSKSVGGLQKMFQGVKSSLVSFAKQFGPAAIAFAVATKAMRAFGDAINFVRQATIGFQKELSAIKAIVQPTAVEFRLLREQAIKLGESTVFTASQAATSFKEMAKLGLTTNQIVRASAGVLDMAAVAGVGMAEAGTTMVETLRQFRLEAGESNRVVDVMAKSFNISGLNFNKFVEAAKFAGPVFGAFDESIEVMTASLAALADQSINSSIAGTGLRRMMVAIQNPTSKAGKLISQLGLQGKTFTEQLIGMRKAGVGMSKSFQLFGQRGGLVAGVLIKNSEKMKQFTERLKDSDGAAKRMADTMLDNVWGAQIKLKSATEALGIAIGEAFSESKQERLEFYASIMRKAKELIVENKEALRSLGKIVSGVIKLFVGFGMTLLNILVTLTTFNKKTDELAKGVINNTTGALTDFGAAAEDSIEAVVKGMGGIDTKTLKDFNKELTESATQFHVVAKEATKVDYKSQIDAFERLRKQLEALAALDLEEIVPTDDTNLKRANKVMRQFLAELSRQQKEAFKVITQTSPAVAFQDTTKAALAAGKVYRAIWKEMGDITVEQTDIIVDHVKKLAEAQNTTFEEVWTKFQAQARLVEQFSIALGKAVVAGVGKGTAGLKESLKAVLLTVIDYLEKLALAAFAGAGMRTLLGDFSALFKLGASMAALQLARQGVSSFRQGGSFTTTGPQFIQVGDNPGGKERVTVEPLTGPNSGFGNRRLDIRQEFNFNGPVNQDTLPQVKQFVNNSRQELVRSIEKAMDDGIVDKTRWKRGLGIDG